MIIVLSYGAAQYATHFHLHGLSAKPSLVAISPRRNRNPCTCWVSNSDIYCGVPGLPCLSQNSSGACTVFISIVYFRTVSRRGLEVWRVDGDLAPLAHDNILKDYPLKILDPTCLKGGIQQLCHFVGPIRCRNFCSSRVIYDN